MARKQEPERPWKELPKEMQRPKSPVKAGVVGERGVEGLDGDGRTNAVEARNILYLVAHSPLAVPNDEWDANFIANMDLLLNNPNAVVTFKQLCKLRDIKDAMIEKGLL